MSSASERLRSTLYASLHDQLCELGVECGLLTREQVTGAPRDGTFEQRLLRDGVLTLAQLSELRRAAAYRVGRTEDKALGGLMASHGYVPESVVQASLDLQRKTFEEGGRLVRLSELMVRSGTLTPGHLVALRRLRSLSFSD
ncbi:MAG: hypothetical protein KDD82_29650 [Planctomycetes bacterium]|nr:hypothetical protein [Planctomycetota bacterium]